MISFMIMMIGICFIFAKKIEKLEFDKNDG